MGRKLVATGMDANTGQFNIMGKDDAFMLPAIVGMSDTPTIGMGSATVVGSGATATIIGNNTAGKITVNTGSGVSLAAGKILTLTFANSLVYPNGSVVTFASANANFTSIVSRLFVTGYTDKVELEIAILALSINTTYIGYYKVFGF